MRKEPLVLSIIGRSDSGKTTLIQKILPKLKEKGYKIAVAKHCPRGFDLDVEGKDSWRFTKAGAEGTFLSSPGKLALIRAKDESQSLKSVLKDYFTDFDIVLTEGYSDDGGINKIQIARKEIGGDIVISDEIIAYVSDMDIDTDKPIYDPNDIEGIISFIEKQGGKR
ncbi:MAG: molybdopterin-guanine dinucleotide biosynthesis protein B [Candidatus Omnitrophota bacterium]